MHLTSFMEMLMFVSQGGCLRAKSSSQETRQNARLNTENENLIKHM